MAKRTLKERLVCLKHYKNMFNAIEPKYKDEFNKDNGHLKRLLLTIASEIPYIDKRPYSHNIIGMSLSIIGEKFNDKIVYLIIENTPLQERGWGYILEQV